MKQRPAYSAVVSTTALLVALSGSAYASGLITGKQIKNGTVTTKDVKNRSIGATDLRRGVVPVVPALDPKAAAAAEISSDLTGIVTAGPWPCQPMRDEVHDPFNMHTPDTDHLDVTATGTYLVIGTMAVDPGEAKQLEARITVNEKVLARTVNAEGNDFEVLTTTALLRLKAGDDVCLGSFTSGGGAQLADVADAPNATLTLQRVAP